MNNTNTNQTKESIIATLAYYRAVKTPLTLVQIGRYLINSGQWTVDSGQKNTNNADLHEMQNILNELVEKKIVSKQKGLYWLNTKIPNHKLPISNENPINQLTGLPNEAKSSKNKTLNYGLRIADYMKFIQLEKNAQRKINIVRRAIKIFRYIPFLKGLFICGSVARKVSRPNSDIDFLVITKKKRVWMVRFIITILASLMGKKTKDANILVADHKSRKNKLCLNHFRSSSNLRLEDNLQDLYSAQEYSRMINIYSGNRIDRKFFKKNKRWMKKILPNFNFTKLPLFSSYDSQTTINSTFEKMLSGKTGDIIEKVLSFIQTKKIIFGRRKKPANGRVIANDNVIMFHLNPRAPVVLKKYERVMTNVLKY